MTWAHPRSRGENSLRAGRGAKCAGSSPLTRGKHQQAGKDARRYRLIPAHAGKTGPGGGRCSVARLIPAHAGKTTFARTQLRGRKAHPRSRGENEALAASDATDKGSSPLTRGKRGRAPARRLQVRLIPAHAGKTPTRLSQKRGVQAHPRSRGENAVGVACAAGDDGSSPLTRGKLYACACARESVGLIPAHAGKTLIGAGKSLIQGAHPRSRGENNARRGMKYRGAGSSPLTRGKPRETFPSLTIFLAHPRSRGENATVWETSLAKHGSSPLTRGKLDENPAAALPAGLIPAHAGKTTGRRQR